VAVTDDDPEVRFFPTPADFRAWLRSNHDTVDELWVGLYKKGTGRPSITWPESVAEALCFGWIDGLRKSIDDDSYRIRFTPRRPGSIWSARNIGTAESLLEAGRMEPAGRAAFDRRTEDRARRYSFEQGKVSLGDAYEATFRAESEAWSFFRSQAPSYQRTMTWWVVSAKRESTRARRLARLVEASAAGERLTP
jgi:uncharacterized protein YdeI (YjbR/CyaY-like superfamily)